MAKKAKSLNKLISFVGAILAVVAVVMIFLPQIASVNGDTTYNGITIAFGKSEKAGIGDFIKGETKINFSFFNFAAYLLVIVGLVITALQMAGMAKGKLLTIIAAAALIAGGVIFFLALSTTTITSSGSIAGFGTSSTVKFADFNGESTKVWQLGFGAIVGGITAILSGVCALGNVVLSK
mgnify:CR=1 FL=1